MRESHETPLTNEQREQVLRAGDAAAKLQTQRNVLANDHGLRKWCVEMAIKSIDAWPSINVPLNAPQATDITNNFTHPDVRLIAEQIYAFVSEPLTKLNGDA